MRKSHILAIAVFVAVGSFIAVTNFNPAQSSTLIQVVPISDPFVLRTIANGDEYTEIYEDGLGTIMYREHDGVNVMVERVATDDEVTMYLDHRSTTELQRAYATAIARLSGNVGVTGQKQVEWLRDRADEADNAFAQWDTWSDAQKDSALQQLFNAQAKTWDGLADLLIFLNQRLGVDAGLDTE